MEAITKNILIIDDEKNIREDLGKFFEDKGWGVFQAENGADALIVLKGISYKCDCIILDQKMPKMDGKQFIKELGDKVHDIPIILLSGYVTSDEFLKYYKGKVLSHFTKPTNPAIIEALADNFVNYFNNAKGGSSEEKKAGSSNYENTVLNMHSIVEKTKSNEDKLIIYFDKTINNNKPFKINEHLFVVARRWNSWYPSFFDVPGGCYAIVSPICKKTKRNRVTVIDPGFRFLEVLASLNISVKDIETCIISHNHPDHIGGAFEYIASRHVAKEQSTFICNPSAFNLFKDYMQQGVNISVMNSNQELRTCKKHDNTKCCLTLESFDTEHKEIGPQSDSKGIIINFRNYTNPRKVVVLGDTSYDLQKHQLFIDKITDHETKVAVLHIGSAQMKERIGGHLYLEGLLAILNHIGTKLVANHRRNDDKLIILISEWGLEHASQKQLSEINPAIKGADTNSLIIEVIDFLKESLKNFGFLNKMTIIPADIGLMVGIDSGKIYLGNNRSITPDELKITVNEKGIIYS
jgi:two-component system, response regulator, stage 0 sporulation protein F